MVFLEAQQLGWEPLIESFARALPRSLQRFREYVESILKWLTNVSMAWALKSGRFYVHRSELIMMATALKYLGTFLEEYNDSDGGTEVRLPKDEVMRELLAQMCLFSVAWGIGGALEEKTRRGYAEVLQRLITAAADVPEFFGI
jgi:hypothetical protein